MDNWETFLDGVSNRFGKLDSVDIEPLVGTTLTEIGSYLPENDRSRLDLPDSARDYLSRGELQDGKIDVATIGEELGTSDGAAVELVESVVMSIDERQSGEASTLWRRHFSEDLLSRVTAPEHAVLASPPSRLSSGRTLADGAPGSSTPLSEGQSVQPDSPVSGSEPRRGSKLSTAKSGGGRPGRTLAEGKPGSSRSLSDDDRD